MAPMLGCCRQQDTDRPPVEILPVDKLTALKQFPKTALSTEGVKCSLPENLMDMVSDTKVGVFPRYVEVIF